MRSASRGQDAIADRDAAILGQSLYFRASFSLFTISDGRLVRLLLFIFVDALEDAVHLLLQEQLELLDHEFIDWAPLDKVGDQTLYSVALIHNDALDSKVCNVHIDVQLSFTFFSTRRLLLGTFLPRVCNRHRTRLIAIYRRGSGIVAVTS